MGAQLKLDTAARRSELKLELDNVYVIGAAGFWLAQWAAVRRALDGRREKMAKVLTMLARDYERQQIDRMLDLVGIGERKKVVD